LFAAGYLLGTMEQPSQAQYFYGSDAEGNPTFGTIHTPTPGGPSYYYGMDGTLGTIVPPPTFSSPKSPC
jgi:hypothetical protein